MTNSKSHGKKPVAKTAKMPRYWLMSESQIENLKDIENSARKSVKHILMSMKQQKEDGLE